jgi:glucose-6-phosphate isomerase
MMETLFLGKLLNVNPFDQPNVESYKRETRKILAEQN